MKNYVGAKPLSDEEVRRVQKRLEDGVRKAQEEGDIYYQHISKLLPLLVEQYPDIEKYRDFNGEDQLLDRVARTFAYTSSLLRSNGPKDIYGPNPENRIFVIDENDKGNWEGENTNLDMQEVIAHSAHIVGEFNRSESKEIARCILNIMWDLYDCMPGFKFEYSPENALRMRYKPSFWENKE